MTSNKKFQREVLKLRPDLRVASGHFYAAPAEHILCGFVPERAGGGTYISRYAFPLYDHVDFIHLAFGDRLPGTHGFIPVEHEAASSEALEFVRRIEPYELETYAWRDIEKFLLLAESLEHLNNPWIRRGHAMTLVMLGRRNEALRQLSALSAMAGIETIPHFREDTSRVSDALSTGIAQAQRTLLEWEVQTKERLGVHSSSR